MGRGQYYSGYVLGNGWTANNNTFSPNLVPSTWGNVDARCQKKAVTAVFDGHAESQNIEQLRDMRKWSNKANKPDWDFQPGS